MSIAEKLTTIAENVPKLYEAGRKSLMEDYLTNYSPENAFANSGWNIYTFYPTRDFFAGRDSFKNHNNSAVFSAYDLVQRLEECGVTMTVSHTTSVFENAKLSRVPEINISQFPTFSLSKMFCNSTIETIEKINFGTKRTVAISTDMFAGCKYLKNIVVEGIINTSLSFSVSPLTVESMKSIAMSLKDFSSDASNNYKYTLTVKSDAFSKLESEGATAEYNGAACTWAELIDNKKWNLTLA